MCHLIMFFGSQCLRCSAETREACECIAECFAPDLYLIEGGAQ